VFLNVTKEKKLALKLRKAFQISASEWLLVIQAMGWFAVVEFGLRVLKLKTLLALLQNDRRTEREGCERTPTSPERVGYCVEVASRLHPLRPTCLKKALVLFALLARRGVKARVVVGTAKSDGKLDAHAWIEHEGRVILGGPARERYSTLCRLDGDWLLVTDRER
jgi:hypothetical protein